MSRRKKIMVVDDEAGIRDLLFDVLSGEGFYVSLAKDGEDSLRQMRKNNYDLIITDINMPRVDGLELLKRMKRAGRKEKVIIMSGNTYDLKRNRTDILKAVTQLDKPFHVNQFLEAVSLALSPTGSRRGRGRHNSKREKVANAL